MKRAIYLLLLGCIASIAHAAQKPTTRLISPNTTAMPDTTGDIILPAYEVDAFRGVVSVWTRTLAIASGGDSSFITLDVAGNRQSISLTTAFQQKMVTLEGGFDEVKIVPAEGVRLVDIHPHYLVFSEQKEKTEVPRHLWKVLESELPDEGLFFTGFKHTRYERELMKAMYMYDKAGILREFIDNKIDTVEHPYWHVRVEGQKVYIHETLGDTTSFRKAPYMSALREVVGKYSSDWLAFNDYNYCLIVDSLTYTPHLHLEGMYKNAIPIDIEFTSVYEVGAITRKLWTKDDGTSILELGLWRKVDIDRYFVGMFFCKVDLNIAGTWCKDTDKDAPEPLCPEVSPGVITSLQLQF